ncbi:phage terminase large subunit [Halobaculum sp. CBA1158]|uniref:PBSX family phage terminase large subunit n=1 Tax=Halobaculum sp. CBA1158 TaxID=2904243 RepID=UPI001F2F617B|nr:phage terminase large subunit [Halobaculum sp. CBA1158]UIO98888.1 phage terminase large subunit [Halobaculum sp. CBA1158]
MSTSTVGQDAVPQPTHAQWDRGRNTEPLRPYVHGDLDVAPQEEFLAGPAGEAPTESTAQSHAFVSGLGAGKTAAGIIRAVANAERWNPGELGMIVAPTSPAMKNAILPVMREFGLLDAWEYRGKGSEQPGLHTPSGSRIILESADNDRKIQRLRGPNLAWVWMDEAAAIAERAWEILAGRLRVGDYRNAFVTTTPKGKNWVYDRFYDDSGKAVHREDPYEVVTANDARGVFGVPSWVNPHNPDDYVERLEREYSGDFFDQEVRGEFTKFEGLVYPWFERDTHVLDETPSPDELDETIYGVDWGHNNPAVVLALGRRGDQWVVLEEFYERRCTVNDQVDVAERIVDQWGTGRVYCDPADASSIETFRRAGLDAVPAQNDVTPGIQAVASKRDELRVVAACQNVRNEFGLYQYKDADQGDDPEKKNDHAMDALRYALFSHERSGGRVSRAGSMSDLLG